MNSWIAFALIIATSDAFYDEIDRECKDKSPYCNTNDCTVRPGYALEYCRKTCGDCEPFCHNSHFVSCKDSRKPECDSMLKDYCPLLCGACRPIKKKFDKKAKEISTARAPLTFADLLKSTVAMRNNASQGPDTAIKLPKKPSDHSFTANNFVQEEDVTRSSVHRSPPKTEKKTANHRESTGIRSDGDDYGDGSSFNPFIDIASEMKANKSDFMIPPDPMRIAPFSPVFIPHSSQWHQSPVNYAPHMSNFPTPYFTSPTQPYFGAPQYQQGYYPRMRPSSPTYYAPPANPQPYGSFTPSVSVLTGTLEEQPLPLPDLITLLGCRDKDPAVCSKLTVESCLSRPGFYMKLCPVKCKNCNGLQCLDSVKIDCDEVRRLGGCKLEMAAEYCPRSCRLCATPPALADSLPPCKDELETCEDLAESGICEHSYSRNTMRIYCAKSCQFCRQPQYYLNDVYRKLPNKSKTSHFSSKTRNYQG